MLVAVDLQCTHRLLNPIKFVFFLVPHGYFCTLESRHSPKSFYQNLESHLTMFYRFRLFPVLLALIGLASLLPAQNRDLDWVFSYDNSNTVRSRSLGVDSIGNIYAAGFFQDSCDFDPGTGTNLQVSAGAFDIWVGKYDAAGDHQWAFSLGSSATETAADLHVDDSGYVTIVGVFNSTLDFDPGPGVTTLTSSGGQDGYIARYDPNGNFVWVRQFTGMTNNSFSQVGRDRNGNYYLAASITGVVDADPGPGTFNLGDGGTDGDILLLKLNSAGNFVWAWQINGNGTDAVSGMDIHPDGDILVCGLYGSGLDLDPGPGAVSLPNAASVNGFIARYDSSGAFQWGGPINSNTLGTTRDIAWGENKTAVTVGTFYGTTDLDPGSGTNNVTANGSGDFYVQKLDAAGNFLWARTAGGADDDDVQAVATDSSGNIAVCGAFWLTTDLDPGPGTLNATSVGMADLFWWELDTAGVLQELIVAGDSGNEVNRTIYLQDDGAIISGGDFNLTVDFDPGSGSQTLTADVAGDFFLARFSECIPTSAAISPISCGPYTAPSGNFVVTTSGTYLDTLLNARGCDSLLTISLTVVTVDTSVTVAFPQLQANATGALYQWLDCDSNLAPIPGATQATFTPTVTGNYAVAVTQSGCSSSSACYNVMVVGRMEPTATWRLFPNPSTGRAAFATDGPSVDGRIIVRDAWGRALRVIDFQSQTRVEVELPGAGGIYFVQVESEGEWRTFRLIKH